MMAGGLVVVVVVQVKVGIARSSWNGTSAAGADDYFALSCSVHDNNIGLSLSEPLQLYQRQSLDSPAGYMYIYLMGTTGHQCKIVQDSAR